MTAARRLLLALWLAPCACAVSQPIPAKAPAPAEPERPAREDIPLFESRPRSGGPYTELGPVEAEEVLEPTSQPSEVDAALRRELQQQAFQAGADAVVDVTFTEQPHWYPPLPNRNLPRRVMHRVAKGVLIRHGSAPQTP